jgi:hypothetical protein
MMRTTIAAMLMMGAIGAASADEAADFMAAAGDQARTYQDCIESSVTELAKTRLSNSSIVDRALEACFAESDAIEKALQGEPTHLSSVDAAKVVTDVRNMTRRRWLSQLDETRKGY